MLCLTKLSHMNLSKKLKEFIDEQTAGIVWLTEKSLNLDHQNLETIDYFLNRAVLNTSRNSGFEFNAKKNIFFATSFDRPFFLLQATVSTTEEAKNVFSELKGLLDEKQISKKIILIDENKKAPALAEAKKQITHFKILEIKH